LFGVPAAYCAPLFDAAPNHGIKSVVAASDHPHDLPVELP
jgi:indolepyruvate decarboxylase